MSDSWRGRHENKAAGRTRQGFSFMSKAITDTSIRVSAHIRPSKTSDYPKNDPASHVWKDDSKALVPVTFRGGV